MYKIQSIQALRFFAALLVVLDHTMLALIYAGAIPQHYSSLAWLMGEMGVYVFFVISGFIMLLTNEERFGREGAIGGFLLRRFIRVAPIYWLFTTWVVWSATRNVPGAITPGQVLKSYLFIPVANADGQMRPVHGVGWTLNYEMLFYGLFALAMAFRFKTGVAAVFGALVVLVVSGMALRWPFDSSEPSTLLQVWTSPILLTFGVGLLIGLARKRFSGEPPMLSSWIPCVLMAAPLFAFQLSGSDEISVIWRICTAVSAIAVVALTAFTKLPALPERVLGYGGDASYSLYLVHTIVIGALYKRLPDIAAYNPVAFFAIAVLASIFAGFVVRHAIEKPLTRLAWAAIAWCKSISNWVRQRPRPSAPSHALEQPRLQTNGAEELEGGARVRAGTLRGE